MGNDTSNLARGTTVTVAAYVVFLGLFMCCAELNISLMQAKCRTRCGFYYSFLGRSIVMFFSGTMAIALVVNDDLSMSWYYIVGGVTCANALWNMVVILCHPAVTRGGGLSMFSDPWAPKRKLADGTTVGASTAEESMVAYLRANPQLAARALAVGAGAAAAVQPTPGTMTNPFRAAAAASAAPPGSALAVAAASGLGTNGGSVARPAMISEPSMRGGENPFS